MNRRVSVAFNRNCFWKIKHYSRLQADAYTLVVSQKDARCCYYTPLTETIKNMWPINSCHFKWPWMTLEIIRLLQGFFKCNSTIIYATFCTVSTDTLRRAVHRRQFSYTCTLNRHRWKKCPPLQRKRRTYTRGVYCEKAVSTNPQTEYRPTRKQHRCIGLR